MRLGHYSILHFLCDNKFGLLQLSPLQLSMSWKQCYIRCPAELNYD